MKQYDIVVSIAGSDSGGGAGIQADLKTLTALGCYSATVITAITAQNTQGVKAIDYLSLDMIAEQFDAVFKDFQPKVVKIGMIGTSGRIQLIHQKLSQLNYKPKIILDPVMIAKDNSKLLNSNAVEALQDLCTLSDMITPNIPEAQVLCAKEITSIGDMEQQALILAKRFESDVLLKGGHLDSVNATDIFVKFSNLSINSFDANRINTHNTHGTGCSLSSAISAFIAKGYTTANAIKQAKSFISRAIDSGSKYHIGEGHGPINHLINTRNLNEF